MKCCLYAIVALIYYGITAAAFADETPFLQSLAGDWIGGGMMKRSTSSSPINLDCNFKTQASGVALSMKGTCRGMIVVTRAVSANIKANGTQYAGTYIGPSGGVSGLQGRRNGDAINLAVHWSRIINGDRSATMTIQRVDDNAIRIRTVDKDPASGQQVVTSEINLRRN
ncbi:MULTISPECIES: hypothetical protein [unclassified Rhizobium]|uniref:hypothetical protein n=1 Tax=unclassified Rhizobium TaxID=2613769 RepID=UPI00160F6640|nr:MULTISPECIES: hypothetical protein [unclassified Rhizobium]MBB3319327.1 hypothetical protein [Rhizobium sp. BK181]MBB3542930.1 hypothetical protein [Rhizobium sp. BK399]MCS4094997.1 hypothetical protein [Rhizobium sp. BK176]